MVGTASMRRVTAGFITACLCVLAGNDGFCETMRVAGTVIAGDGPAAGASVHLAESVLIAHTARTATRMAETEADGTFSFEIDEALVNMSRYERPILAVHHPGRAAAFHHLSPYEDSGDLNIRLERSESISGRVVDGSGKPVADAGVGVVMVQPYGSFGIPNGATVPELSAVTSSDGSFTIDGLPRGSTVVLDAVADGFALSRRSGIPAGYEDVKIVLGPGGSIRGRVIDGASGRPLPGAAVMALGSNDSSNFMMETSAGADGRYAIENLPSMMYRIQAVVEEDGMKRVTAFGGPVWLDEGESVGDCDMKTMETGLVTGTVRISPSGDAAGGQIVKVLVEEVSGSRSVVGYATTDAGGTYRLKAPAGTVSVTVDAPPSCESRARVERTVTVAPGGRVGGVDFTFDEGARLTCRVEDGDGEPVGGAAVIASAIFNNMRWVESGRTGPGGLFSAGGAASDAQVDVQVLHTEMKLWGSTSCSPGGDGPAQVVMQPYETVSLDGSVRDSDGKPVAGFTVDCALYPGRRGGMPVLRLSTLTDGAGRYGFDGLIAGKEYQLTAYGSGYSMAHTSVRADGGDTGGLTDLTIETADRWMEGTVKNGRGAPVAWASIMAMGGGGYGRTYSRADGSFRLEGLSEDMVRRLSIRHGEYGRYEFDEIPTNETREFTLVRPDKQLAGRLVGSDGEGIRDAMIFARPGSDNHGFSMGRAVTDDTGAFSFGKVIADSLDLMVRHRDLGRRDFPGIETNRDDIVLVWEDRAARNSAVATPPTDADATHDFTVSQWLAGGPVSMEAFRGKIVVIDFWSCENDRCREALESMQALHEQYAGKGVVVIGVHAHTADTSAVRAAMEDAGVTYPVAVDVPGKQEGSPGIMHDRYGVGSRTMNVIIDAKGERLPNVWDALTTVKVQRLVESE